VPLDDTVLVRSSISIVPQTPDLFEGTLRDNIDPLHAYTDHEIWMALEQVCKYFVPALLVFILDSGSPERFRRNFS